MCFESRKKKIRIGQLNEYLQSASFIDHIKQFCSLMRHLL